MSAKTYLIAAIYSALCFLFFTNGTPSDFLAVYFAGLQYGAGQFDQIYPALIPVFDLSYPASWDELAINAGIDTQTEFLYPFIYPPLWAAVASWIVPYFSVKSLFYAVYAINSLLLAACSLLAWRIARPSVSPEAWFLFGYLFCAVTTFGFIALAQGQPQILTTFLILLAIERTRYSAQITAGAALALAASIKLYPLLFIVIWAARGNWRALSGFAVTGAVLAGASVLLAGWPLHREFLDQIDVISNSILITYLNYNLSALISAITTPELFGVANLTAFTQSNAISISVKFLLGLSLVLVMLRARHATEDVLYRKIWPVWIIIVSFLSPMNWAYHFLTALVFLPLALEKQNRTPGLFFVAAILVLTSIPSGVFLNRVLSSGIYGVITGSLAVLLMVVMFAVTKDIKTRYHS